MEEFLKMNERYSFKEIEKKWQKYWEASCTASTPKMKSKKKYYCLEMFPYPSGKLHMGHVRNYSIGDVGGKIKTDGYNVLHPMNSLAFLPKTQL